MIIKKIQIENFLCYYGTKTFILDKGLNIILGENNEGKTKFFEAVYWLFNGSKVDNNHLVSAKKADEIALGDHFKVGVSMVVEQYGNEKRIERSFIVNKDNAGEVSTTGVIFNGYETDEKTGERIPVSGESLLETIFPHQIRRYSMFKGERALDIFENEEALGHLIDLFSDANFYKKYSEKGAFLREKAQAAVDASTRASKKNQIEYDKIEQDIKKLNVERIRIETFFKNAAEQKEKIENLISDAEKYVTNAEQLKTINERIEKLKEKISQADRIIDYNFTNSLFDDNWILLCFEPFQRKFANKISSHSKIRREIQTEYDRLKGIKEGEKKARFELLNNAIPLPITVPGKAHMEEMLVDEICKVCNREAKKGSEPYEYMTERLRAYLESQQINEEDEDDEDDVLFPFDFLNRLEKININQEDNLFNIRNLFPTIIERFELIIKMKGNKANLEKDLEKEMDERQWILGRSKIGDETKLLTIFKNYTDWQEQLKDYSQQYTNYEADLKAKEKEIKAKELEKEKIDLNNATAFLLKTRDILKDIEIIFNETKEKKFDEFIVKLEEKSNQYLAIINVEAFTGRINLIKKRSVNGKDKIEIMLTEQGGRKFEPGTAVETSVNISILLAISELANEVRDESYPMILDAPTSSFGDTKSGDFLNLIYETKNQKIILLKNFIDSIKDENGMIKDLYIKEQFNTIKRDKAFWVKLERPFEKEILNTINTIVHTL